MNSANLTLPNYSVAELPLQDEQMINAIVSQARKSHNEILSWDDKKLDSLVAEIAIYFKERITEICVRELKETKIGNVSDKEHKLMLIFNKVLPKLLGVKMQGKIGEIDSTLYEYADPIGVIFGLIPITNPVTNSLYKILLAIKTRNAIIMSYPKSALELGMFVINGVQEVLEAQRAPRELVQNVPVPSSTLQIKSFMSHPGVDLIIAGGANLLKAAYSSGKPVYSEGVGNVPVYLSETADLHKAAEDIIKSKCYDNGIVCSSESSLLVNYQVKHDFIGALEQSGAVVLNDDEAKIACELFFDPVTQKLKPEFIGVNGSDLAAKLSLKRVYPVRLIVLPADQKNRFWLGKAKMAPILAMFIVDNAVEGVKLAKQFLLQEGIGHTAAIHSQDQNEIDQFAVAIPAGRLLVNTPSTQGMLGETTNLITSFMLGCGTYGGGITTDALTWRNFVNIKRLAFHTDARQEEIVNECNFQW